VGTGFDAAALRLLGERLAPLRREDAPLDDVPREHARHAVWVDPMLVVECDYAEWTREGRLRHPSYEGLRDDVDPRSVVRQ
jgi:bifunctional non-homologous end joining protein LigD